MVTAEEKALLCDLSAQGPLLDALLPAESRAEAQAADKARAAAHYVPMAAEAVAMAPKPMPAWVDPAHVVGGVRYAGADWTVAAEHGESAELYGVLINGHWLPAVDTLSEWALMGLQAALDEMPANDSDDGPADFDAEHAADLACAQYECMLDARASR